ncbi:MAG: glyceraldehyde 3-phosphate dehydrogenase NAD-binding domain-containing protein [Candidatus Shapirobacteria bacterium]|nr:glyceraldehyde 3-phosphate dehydrogenase NAD-binding domain-containing protein [Candidatus Shapirobacteria bacterium]MDD5073870.1 glyceraldehyde 3-phosphate dehydrogenase NAD-binding domain-containing protein [Candidatus Shapirobacteria bacterium]MDD5481747.1 glyceraldehyde 3-phosphate dehydrogenase NAD-binding domain-containing protein [Candidatus Shapirobacteria bacterium]
MLNLAITGFGRIGRITLRTIRKNYVKKARVVAINTSGSMDAAGWAHLFKYDSVYGTWPEDILVLPPKQSAEIGRIKIGKDQYPVLAQKDPAKIAWRDYKVDTVLECTGAFLNKKAENHFLGGAKKVVLSAPPKDSSIPTFVLGVNDKQYQKQKLVSNASCTTNCVAPIVKVIDQAIGFQEALMTTIHAYTASQQVVDGSDKDLRRARAAAVNLVPTGTGAAKSVEAVYPEIAGRFAATAIRAPIICGSYSTFIFKTNRATSVDEVNQILESQAAKKLAGILAISYDPLVSSDIVGISASAVVDAASTKVVSDDLLYLSAWYDNEWAYSCRLAELAIKIGR